MATSSTINSATPDASPNGVDQVHLSGPSNHGKIQPWKDIPGLASAGKTWEEMPFKMIDEDSIRLVDVYQTLTGGEKKE